MLPAASSSVLPDSGETVGTGGAQVAAGSDRFALECWGITKYWSSRRAGQPAALDGVDFAVAPGEIHVLLGENGAGKSTLVKIAAGLVRPDAGEVWVDGVLVSPGSVAAAQAAGVSLIHQE